ncbi:unnamed protein product [Rotaria sp. Silwood2]|nr:unnamed protein product [Rotaria sp. Silwood2]CAF2581367.1 unnamed protein product [Rotaria sp. Silwood2]CAF2989143.1 unnamed protein product [Rotaria sp. Silwood2]CAF3977091.1 unnamed protein product [Rotaria sp. Silwood2]CAF4057726.1 unnamed protein product [Rotaria sp. Silwood2]
MPKFKDHFIESGIPNMERAEIILTRIAPLSNYEDIIDSRVICVKYRNLSFDDDNIFTAKLLDNVSILPITLKPQDSNQMTSYRSNIGLHWLNL